jgi:serine/threonine protein kinase
VPGENLATRLERDGPLPIAAAIKVATEVAEGLAEAHSHGVVHRDLKPHNVMTAGGRAKILDFGLSKPVSVEVSSDLTTQRGAWTGPHETPGQIVGTVAYMAPEQTICGTSTSPPGARARFRALPLFAGTNGFGPRSLPAPSSLRAPPRW